MDEIADIEHENADDAFEREQRFTRELADYAWRSGVVQDALDLAARDGIENQFDSNNVPQAAKLGSLLIIEGQSTRAKEFITKDTMEGQAERIAIAMLINNGHAPDSLSIINDLPDSGFNQLSFLLGAIKSMASSGQDYTEALAMAHDSVHRLEETGLAFRECSSRLKDLENTLDTLGQELPASQPTSGYSVEQARATVGAILARTDIDTVLGLEYTALDTADQQEGSRILQIALATLDAWEAAPEPPKVIRQIKGSYYPRISLAALKIGDRTLALQAISRITKSSERIDALIQLASKVKAGTAAGLRRLIDGDPETILNILDDGDDANALQALGMAGAATYAGPNTLAYSGENLDVGEFQAASVLLGQLAEAQLENSSVAAELEQQVQEFIAGINANPRSDSEEALFQRSVQPFIQLRYAGIGPVVRRYVADAAIPLEERLALVNSMMDATLWDPRLKPIIAEYDPTNNIQPIHYLLHMLRRADSNIPITLAAYEEARDEGFGPVMDTDEPTGGFVDTRAAEFAEPETPEDTNPPEETA